MFKRVSIFSGNANFPLTQEICQVLEQPMGKSRVSRFSDGETFCVIQENVRGVDTYVVQDEGTTYRYRSGAARSPVEPEVLALAE